MSRHYTRLSPDEKRTIEAMYADGYTFVEIGVATGRSWQAGREYLLRAGLHKPVHVRSSPEARAKAVEWYGRGVHTDIIQRRCGVSCATLYGELRRRGIALRLSQRVTE